MTLKILIVTPSKAYNERMDLNHLHIMESISKDKRFTLIEPEDWSRSGTLRCNNGGGVVLRKVDINWHDNYYKPASKKDEVEIFVNLIL